MTKYNIVMCCYDKIMVNMAAYVIPGQVCVCVCVCGVEVPVYLLTAIGQPHGGISTVHIYTQTVHRTTRNKQYTEQHKNFEECGPCPVFVGFTLAFALQLRKKHGKTGKIGPVFVATQLRIIGKQHAG